MVITPNKEMTRKLFLFLVLLTGCQLMGKAATHDDRQPVSDGQAVAVVESAVLSVLADSIAGDNPLQRFEGNIGPFAITLFWNPSDFGEGDTVGNYYYNDRPNSVFTLKLVTNEAVNAKGSMHVVLKEYTAKGNHTGTFDGQYEARGGGFEGTFTTSKGKEYHFELIEK